MVALGATWYGLTRPDFFQQGQHLNSQTYHDKLLSFYQNEVMNCSNTKIDGSNGMVRAVILIKRLSNGVGRTLNCLFRRTDGHLTHLN